MDTYADPSYANLRRAVVVVRPLRNIPDILVPLASSAPMKPEDIIRRIAVQVLFSRALSHLHSLCALTRSAITGVQSREVSSAISSHQISARIEQYIQTLQTMGSLMPGALFDTPATTRFLPYTQFSFMAEGDHDARSCANFIAAMAPTPF